MLSGRALEIWSKMFIFQKQLGVSEALSGLGSASKGMGSNLASAGVPSEWWYLKVKAQSLESSIQITPSGV